MREKIRDKKIGNSINVTLSDGRLWSAQTFAVIGDIQRMIAEYMKLNIKLTLRQLYYQLVSKNIIPNDIKVYSKLSKLITDARYAGLIDWNAIEDRERVPIVCSEWDNVSGLVDSAIRSYRLPRWEDQDNYVELFTEKRALSSILAPIANKWHINFCVNKGYASATAMYDLYERVSLKIKKKRINILYLGDHDPSGLDMNRDIYDRLGEFLCSQVNPATVSKFEMEDFIDANVEFHHIALTADQINTYMPPPNPAKIKDPRAKGYIEEHGTSSWEVDALKPEVMMGIVDDAIADLVDEEKYEAVIARENRDKEKLVEVAKAIVSK